MRPDLPGLLPAAFVAALLSASPALAGSGQSATAQGRAEAIVIQPIVTSALSDLDFGILTSSRTASGSITVDPANGAHYTGGASPACLGGGGACPGIHASEFAVRGEATRSYLVDAPSSIVATGTLVGSGGSAPDLAIETLTVRTRSKPASGESGTLDANGEDRFTIGGTLMVPAGTNPAHYRATLTVIVSYS